MNRLVSIGMFRYRSRVAIAIAAMAIGAVITQVLVTALVIAGDDDAAKRREGMQIGQSFAKSGESAVMTVNGNPVSEARFQLARNTVNSNVKFMAESIQSAELPSEGLENLRRRLNAIESAGVDTVALASLMLDTAVEDAARTSGLAVSETEISERLADHRLGIESGDSPANEGFAAALGGAYWTEYLPDLYERVILSEKLRQSVVAEATDAAEAAALWTAFERELATSADAVIVAADQVGSGSLDGAKAYLETYWRIPR